MCPSTYSCAWSSALCSKWDLQICVVEKGFFILWWFVWDIFFFLFRVEGFFPFTLKRLCAVRLLPVLVFRPEGAGIILSENTEQKTLSSRYLFLLSVCLIAVCPVFLEKSLLLCICKKRSDRKDNYEFRLITALRNICQWNNPKEV